MRTIKSLRFIWLLWACATPLAHAHSLNLVVERSKGQVTGLATYSHDITDGDLFLAIEVSENEPPFALLGRGQTDATGHFRLHLDSDKPLRVTVYGEEGHQAQAVVAPLDGASLTSAHHLDDSALMSQLWLPALLVGAAFLIGIARWVGKKKQL